MKCKHCGIELKYSTSTTYDYVGKDDLSAYCDLPSWHPNFLFQLHDSEQD